MIVDCFPFYNEIEVLEMRLEELKHVVDQFILVESCQTYSGKPKPYVFEAHQQQFQQYNILYIKLGDFPPALPSAWHREEYTRNALAEGLKALNLAPTDVLLLSDVDEIPRAELVGSCAQGVASGEIDCCVFNQTLCYYYVNCQSDHPWQGTRMIRYDKLTTMQEVRSRDGAVIFNGGWHFGYLGGPERVREKIEAYSHTELDLPQYTNPAHLQRCLSEGIDLFGRDIQFRFVPLDEGFPHCLIADPEKWQHLIGQPRQFPSAQMLFEQALSTPTDIHQHLDYLYRLASTVEHITELGTHTGQSTAAFLYARPKRLIWYDRERSEVLPALEAAAQELDVEFSFRQQDVLMATIEPTDLLFIDTWHVEQQMREELRLHANLSRRYLVMHDTETYGQRGASEGHRGIWYAIADFMRANPHWRLWQHFPHNNGLTVFTRV